MKQSARLAPNRPDPAYAAAYSQNRLELLNLRQAIFESKSASVRPRAHQPSTTPAARAISALPSASSVVDKSVGDGLVVECAQHILQPPGCRV